MSINIPSLYVQQFAMNIQLLLQQKESRLRGLVMTGSHVGEQASPVDQVGSIEMQAVENRFATMSRTDAAVDRRWCSPLDFDLMQMIDSFDRLKLLTDPSSVYVTNAVQAANRKMDDIIIDAFFADAKTGKSGTGTTTFLSGNVVAVNQGASGNTGLTVAKLREARRLLRSHEVDLDNDPITAVITSKQEDNLLAEAQVISLDFNDRPVLVDGKLKSFLGINFVHSERLDNDSTPYRRVPVFAKSGMYLGLWNDIKTDVSQRKDIRSLPFQAYVWMSAGATRLEEKKIVEIKCAE